MYGSEERRKLYPEDINCNLHFRELRLKGPRPPYVCAHARQRFDSITLSLSLLNHVSSFTQHRVASPPSTCLRRSHHKSGERALLPELKINQVRQHDNKSYPHRRNCGHYANVHTVRCFGDNRDARLLMIACEFTHSTLCLAGCAHIFVSSFSRSGSNKYALQAFLRYSLL